MKLAEPGDDRDPVKPQLVIISYHFPPSTAIGAVRPYRLYKYLRRSGYRCHIVTASAGAANANPDVIEIPDQPAHWRETRQSWELRGEIERVVRRFLLPGHVGVTWALEASLVCERLTTELDQPPVILTTFPPIGALLAGLLAKYRTGLPWIADFRDPVTVPQPEKRSWLTRYCLSRIEAGTFKRADAIISNVDAAAEGWRQQYPWAADKISVIWNGYDPDENVAAKALPLRNEHVLLHAGSLYGGRNANVVLHTVRNLRLANAPEVQNLQVHLLGAKGSQSEIDEELSADAVRDNWLKMLPAVSPAQALEYSQTADGLLLLQPHTSVQIPAKLFQYVCIGRPILALAPRGSAVEQVLSQSGIPHVCLYPDAGPGENEARLVRYLGLPSTPVQPSRWFLEKFDVTRHAESLMRIVDRVTNSASPVTARAS